MSRKPSLVSSEAEKEFSIYLRIPGWCQKALVTVEGRPIPDTPQPGSYYEIKGSWKKKKSVFLEMTIPPVLMISNPMAAENRCSAAVKRGPIVYCFEGVDNPGISVRQARLKVDSKDPTRNLKAKFYPNLLKGVTVITSEGMVPEEDWGLLYRSFETEPIKTKPVILRAIPYYAWGNRGSSEMSVWLPYELTKG